MNVSLTPRLDAYVRDKVEDGLYGSASEVVRDALRLLEEHDRDREAHLDALRRDLARRLRDADIGDFVDPADMFDRLKGVLTR